MIDWVAQVFSRQWSRRWLCLVYLGLAVFFMRGVLFSPGAIGLRNDWLIVPLPGETAVYIRHLLSSWPDSGLGGAAVRSGSTPFFMVISIASLVLGVSAAALSKLIPLLAIAGAGFAANSLIFSIVRRGPPAFFGSLIYMFSPLVFNLVVNGHIHLFVSYALLPWLVVTFRRALTVERSRSWIIVSALLFALLQDNVQVASLLILLPLWFLVVVDPGHQPKRIKRGLSRAAAIGFLAVLIQAPFVLPAVFQFQEYRTYAQQIVQFSSNRLVSPSLVNAFTLDGAGYRYFAEAIPKPLVPWLTAGHIALFCLALSAFIWRRYRRDGLLWGAVALGSLFLFKGVNPPFGVINQWLVDHVFLMSAFRNVQYFTILTNLALSVLLGIWLTSFFTAVSSRWRLSWVSTRQLSFGLYSLLVIVLLLFIYPYLGGTFNGEVQTYTLHSDYAALTKLARRETRDGRWLLLPPAQPLRYGVSRFAGLDPLGLRVPTAIGPAAEQPWQQLLTMLLYTALPINPGQILCDAAVHTVLARQDFTSETPRFQWEEFPRATWTNEQVQQSIVGWDQLNQRQQLADGQATLYGVSAPCGRLTTAAQATLSSGTLSDVVDLVDYPHKEVPTNPVLFTAQQTPGILTRLPGEAIERVTLAQNNLLDLTRLFLSKAIEVPITTLARDAKQGWSPLNGWWWKDWHYATVLDPGAVVATGRQTARGVFMVEQAGPAELWIKAMHTRSGSTLTVRVDDIEIGQVATHESLLQGLVWTRLPLGRLTAGRHTVTISSGGGENLLARLLVVADSDAVRAEQASAQWLFDRDVVLALTFATRNLAAYHGVFGADDEATAAPGSQSFRVPVPRDGLYTVAAHVAVRPYLSAVEQLESDYLDYIAAGKRVGQIFELKSGVQLLHSLKFKLQARYPGSNVPAATAPDAPLTTTVYRLDDTTGTKELVAQVDVAAQVAPVNDQWEMIEVPIEISLDGRGGRFMVELTSPTTKVGWAAATVNNGFGGVADHYVAGTMTVDDEPQPRDLVFTVQTKIGFPDLARLQLDDHVLPFTLSESWQELGRVELLAGSHTLTMPVNNPHLRIDQIIVRSAGTVTAKERQPPPALTYRRARPTSLQTVKPVSGQSPYWLIFKDAWHAGWQTSPRSDNHLVVNGFANAWWIEPPSGPYHHVSVRYTPQRYTDVGLVISGVAFLGLVGWLLWRRRSQLTVRLDPWRGKQMSIVIGIAILSLLTASVLALAGRVDGAQAAASAGMACFAVALLFQVLKGSQVSARMQGLLVIIVVIALVGWRIASQLDRPAARQVTQPPPVTAGQ